MGDRHNIILKFPCGNQVVFYSHSKGMALLDDIYMVIKRGERLNDHGYFARILFCEVVMGKESSGLGFGIAPHILDQEYEPIVMNLSKQSILFTHQDLHGEVEMSYSAFADWYEKRKGFNYADYPRLDRMVDGSYAYRHDFDKW